MMAGRQPVLPLLTETLQTETLSAVEFDCLLM